MKYLSWIFVVVLIFCCISTSACGYCMDNPGEKELHYQGWYQINITRDDFSRLYHWYIYNFNIKDAYVYLEKLRGGEVISIGGTTIASTKFNRNIVYPKPRYLIPNIVIQLIPVYRIPKVNGREEMILVGCLPAYYYISYLEDKIRELNERGYTEIRFNTKSKPFIKIKVM